MKIKVKACRAIITAGMRITEIMKIMTSRAAEEDRETIITMKMPEKKMMKKVSFLSS